MAKVRVLPLGAAEATVEAYRAAAGVAHHLVLATRRGEVAHRDTALAAVRELISREQQRKAKHSKRPLLWGSSDVETARFDDADAAGEPISLRTFVGPSYDIERGCLTADRVDEREEDEDFITRGYAEVFGNPPYGMRADLDQLNRWFVAINDALFGGLCEDLDVWSWSTDWSSWFDPGHEWWGCFLWTIRPPDGRPMVAIAASATD